VTSAKFKLLGTSFYALHPDLSLALIDEVGKGIRWVRRSGRVGHLVIDQIKDGLVVVKDGERTFEVAVVERPKKVNLIKSPTLDKTDAKAALQPGWQGVTAGQMSAEESAESRAEKAAALDELVRELKAIQAVGEFEQAGTEQGKKDGDALEKFIESIRIDAEEAKKLNNLGKELQNGGEEPNLAEDRSTKVERKPQQREK
jgi:N-acetyl-beta-hexosaminidase